LIYIHPTAIVESKDIGDGTRIWHFVHIREGAVIGKNCNIGKSVYIDTGVVIGDRVKIQNFATIYRGVTIEDDVFIGPAVVFTNDLYPRAFIWGENRIIETKVRKGASIGANATIVCGVEVGEYAMVGAGSVVTKDIPPHGLVYGNPARLRGFVCYCGRRLRTVMNRNRKWVEYKCDHCGKKVRVRCDLDDSK